MDHEQQSSPRQTLSYIRDLLQSRGMSPKSKMGQNFLIDLNLVDLMLESSELSPTDCVLEVGTGTGGLTSRLSDGAGAVFSVELDGDFHRMASEVLAERSNVKLMKADILENKNKLNPDVIQGWDAWMIQHACVQRKMIANLPYVVATPVIANLLITEIPIERMVVMLQWELAERLVAEKGTKDYSALSVLVQGLADVEIIRRLAPSVFWPRPKVDSAIVRIRPNAEKRARIPNVVKFRAFLRDLYTHRRKNLRQALAGWPTGRKDKKEVDARLEELGIDGTLRAETMDLTTHLKLSEAFGE